ncbi:MAG: TIGR00725 family protein [Actinomycetota bacterium]
MTRIYVAVCGPGEASERETGWAEEVGRRLAEAGATIVCGGLGGVMDAAARGAADAGGTTIGILPGETRSGEGEHLTTSVVTGMGEARNTLVVRSADAIIAIAGEFGTLSEIALALKMGKPVVGLSTWGFSKPDGFAAPDPIVRASDPAEAVTEALRLAGR